MTVMASNVNPPKPQKKASKKNKKSWRKNTDVEDVEEFLEDQRLEERLGGAFDKRSDSDIFVVDNTRTKPTECDIDTSINLSKREARKKKAREKTFKCFSSLDIEMNSGVQDPKKGRDSRKTPEERKNPTLKKKEDEMAQAGIIRPKMAKAIKQRQQQKDKKSSALFVRSTRRRTKFDFDLWDKNVTLEGDVKVHEKLHGIDNNQWLEQQTKDHNLNNTRQMKRKAPTGYYVKETSLSAVEVPHGGTSYNPSYKEHQDLLWKAAMVELNKEKEQHKIDFHTTDMFPKSGDAPNENTWVAEMSEGIAALEKTKVNIEATEDDSSVVENTDQLKMNKPKTKKQRRDALKLIREVKRKEYGKRKKMEVLDVYRVKTMTKEMKAEEKKIAHNMAKRNEQKEMKKSLPAHLTGHKFEEQDLDLKLSEELTGSLKSLKPEGNLLTDRFKSMQKRNIIETRVKQKIVKNKRKRKLVVKRNYKMGFDWEKNRPGKLK